MTTYEGFWGKQASRPKTRPIAGKSSATMRRIADALQALHGRPATEPEIELWAAKPAKAIRRLLEGEND